MTQSLEFHGHDASVHWIEECSISHIVRNPQTADKEATLDIYDNSGNLYGTFPADTQRPHNGGTNYDTALKAAPQFIALSGVDEQTHARQLYMINRDAIRAVTVSAKDEATGANHTTVVSAYGLVVQNFIARGEDLKNMLQTLQKNDGFASLDTGEVQPDFGATDIAIYNPACVSSVQQTKNSIAVAFAGVGQLTLTLPKATREDFFSVRRDLPSQTPDRVLRAEIDAAFSGWEDNCYRAGTDRLAAAIPGLVRIEDAQETSYYRPESFRAFVARENMLLLVGQSREAGDHLAVKFADAVTHARALETVKALSTEKQQDASGPKAPRR